MQVDDILHRVEAIDRKLEAHINDETQKLDAVHEALFHPETGLVNVKKWMCRIATWCGVIICAILSALAAIASAGHSFGWW